MKCEAGVVLNASVVAQDVRVQLHLAVGPRQLEGLVHAARQHQELDGRLEVVQSLEEPTADNGDLAKIKICISL